MSAVEKPASSAIADRILSLRQRDETWSDFAARVHLSPQVISNFRTGRSGASLESVVAVVRAVPVNPNWLLTGAGPRSALGPPSGPGGAASLSGVMEAIERLEAALDDVRDEWGGGPVG